MGQRFKVLAVIVLASLALVSNRASAEGSGDQFNFRFSPVGILFGSLNANLDIAVSNTWTVGPQLGYSRFKFGTSDSNFDITGYSIGARGNWFKNGTYTDGLYLAPAVSYQRVSGHYNRTNGSQTDVSANGPNVSFIVGYGWFWSSFNMMLGIGGQAQLGDSSVTATNSDGSQSSTKIGTGVTGEYTLGWTF